MRKMKINCRYSILISALLVVILLFDTACPVISQQLPTLSHDACEFLDDFEEKANEMFSRQMKCCLSKVKGRKANANDIKACLKQVLGQNIYQEIECVAAVSYLVNHFNSNLKPVVTKEIRDLVESMMTNCPGGDGFKCLVLTAWAAQYRGTALGDYLNEKARQACGMTAY